MSPDQMVVNDNWSDLSRVRDLPDIDFERMHTYRSERLKTEMRKHDVPVCIMVNPISLRYAINYRNYAQFMAHIPSTYLFYPLEGEILLHNAFDQNVPARNKRPGQPISFFYGGDLQSHYAEKLAQDVIDYLVDIGTDKRRVAVEYVNPSITQALEKRGLEVVDGVLITERAHVIKSPDEIECIRWAVAVAEHGAAKVKEALKPGVSELQLWALLNYANLANNGDWHDGRMLASGPRINPWLQEASERKVEAGDLMGFDTDMIGPSG
ncbi:MAG: M24 family metallopeptidase, partial [Pseudomonadota bacterium]